MQEALFYGIASSGMLGTSVDRSSTRSGRSCEVDGRRDGRPVPIVVMGHGSGAALLERSPGWVRGTDADADRLGHRRAGPVRGLMRRPSRHDSRHRNSASRDSVQSPCADEVGIERITTVFRLLQCINLVNS